MRDPTRGGVATSLNELARDCGLGVVLWEESVPIREPVRGACELLGLDPLHIANEGQFLAVVAPELADAALAALRATPGGEEAVIIGEVREEPARTVLGVASYGGTRVSTCWWATRCPGSADMPSPTPSRRSDAPVSSRSSCSPATGSPPPSSRARARGWPWPARRWRSASCAAAGCSPSGGPVRDRRAARRRRVRPPGDRRQAGPAGARPLALASRSGWRRWPAPRTW